MSIIEDGKGQGRNAEVDKNNRLQVKSVSEGFNVEAAILGDNYNINTGAITLTSADNSAVFYLKNTNEELFIITEVIVILGTSTGGSGDTVVKIIKNPTTGTIISTATDADNVENRNFGSSKLFGGHVFKGVEGDDFTNGSEFANTTRSTNAVINFDADVMVLPKDSTVGVEVEPATGNTSQVVKVAVVGFLFEN